MRPKLLLAVILAATLPSLAFAGDPQNLTVKPGMILLRLANPAPEGADVSWEVRSPAGVSYNTFENSEAFSSHTAEAKGQPLVVVSDVISWDETAKRIKRDKTVWTITVEGAVPPTPPNPPVPPQPRPQGLAGDVFDRAVAIGQPSVATAYSARLDSVSSQIGAGVLKDVPSILQALRTSTAGVATDSKWVEFGAWVSTIRFSTTEQAKATIDAVSQGLRAAGGGR